MRRRLEKRGRKRVRRADWKSMMAGEASVGEGQAQGRMQGR
ncbi:hypothetical protein OPIT5_01975 [Opitutaceae bacterium TAV5]|nr:hypothetical protein OPIT5_01975 [Opitutaceae bacterium TAV5]